ncbi:RNA-directed DNA polymerase (reversetranscriptase)-related family protein [Striga asiatica]|uniref:RNA-directed DNA polymerase (Reversetranscriptase)-related family protein n=1 Tax=Striga asiatica TaxID=4170 RepID=A0A5A7QE68_STRAF|nr:RNA-directed DNA polymerase (reversetranscriptase)-related family protein [Striga asiatica]
MCVVSAVVLIGCVLAWHVSPMKGHVLEWHVLPPLGKSWKSLALPKSQGGLGFMDILLLNKALIAKLIWRVLTKSNLLIPNLKDFKPSSVNREHSLLLWVKDLIDSTGRNWNLHLLQQTFSKDSFGSSYFAKLVAKKWNLMDQAESSKEQHTSPQKCLANILPVSCNLLKKGVNVDNAYSCCGDGPQTLAHLTWDGLNLKPITLRVGGPKCALSANLQSLKQEYNSQHTCFGGCGNLEIYGSSKAP